MDPLDALRAEREELHRLRNEQNNFHEALKELQDRNAQQAREVERLQKKLEDEMQAFEETQQALRQIFDREKERKAGRRDRTDSSNVSYREGELAGVQGTTSDHNMADASLGETARHSTDAASRAQGSAGSFSRGTSNSSTAAFQLLVEFVDHTTEDGRFVMAAPEAIAVNLKDKLAELHQRSCGVITTTMHRCLQTDGQDDSCWVEGQVQRLACRACYNTRRLCIVPNGINGLAVLPLPHSVRPQSAVPGDEEYYIRGLWDRKSGLMANSPWSKERTLRRGVQG